MADFFCSFLDFRSLTTSYKLPLFLPSKHYNSSALHSHNSRISRIKRRPLHLTLLSKPSSSNFDVISTHEHSDGSLLFRFGDPSEVAKNVKMEESKTVEEEIEGEVEDGSSVVKVVDNDNETEVMAKKAEREVTGSGLTEVAAHTNSIVTSSKTITVVEGDSESCEKLLNGSIDTKLPVLTSSKEMEIISTPDVDIEHIENVKKGLNEENEDSSSVEASILDESSMIENNIATVELSEKETADVSSTSKETEVTSTPGVNIEQTGNVEEGLNEEYEDSPVDASILDESSEVMDNITTVALSEKETADITSTDIDIEQTGNVEEGLNEEFEDSPVDASILDKSSEVVNNISTVAFTEKETADITSIPNIIDIEHTGNVEEGLDEEHEESSPVNASTSDKTPEVENNVTTAEFSEKETAESTTLVSLMTDPIIAVPENDVFHASMETVVTTDVSLVSEHQNVETEMQNETIEDGRESFDSNLVSSSPQSESAISLSKEIEGQNLQAAMQNVMDNGNASDTYDAEANSSVGSEDQASGAGSGMPNETVGYVSEKDMIQLMTVAPRLEADSMLEEETGVETVEESREDDGSENLPMGGDLVEASVHEVTVPTTMSQEMLITDFVLSSGAALLPHPSKVLTGGEDAYFIAGQTWLGVADGVGQWSLEGTKPGVYAQELIKNCEKLISDCNGDSINNPVKLLNLSVAETSSPGSSTVLIALFDGQALHVANVGDSGFIVIRNGAVYKRSSPMHHVFHFPLQIEIGDDPSSLAEFYRVDLEEDDVIITATDGLLDNLYDQEISLIVMKSFAADKKLEEIAELLATKAQEIGSSASVRSPFADDAQAAGFAGYTGGKLDDVAVIVSVVQRQSNSQTL